MPPKVPDNDLDPWLWPWTQPRNKSLAQDVICHFRPDFKLNLTSDMIVTCACAQHTFSLCSIFLWSFIKFASEVFELLLKDDFDLWP